MEQEWLLAIIGALGVKEIWVIIKKRMDINAKKDEREGAVTLSQIDELNKKIDECQSKISELIEENTTLKVKLARMEERLLLHAKNKVKRKKDDSL
tara:strand:- start:6102 stop:6389 length:288 start_codon:yes stop_codon:yes gene_type:complete